jgi:hypothetical protein
MTMAAELFFFFSRKMPMPRDGSRHLVSGVMKAVDIDEARRKLDALLIAKKNPARADDFDFCDLAATEFAAHGLVAMTIGE